MRCAGIEPACCAYQSLHKTTRPPRHSKFTENFRIKTKKKLQKLLFEKLNKSRRVYRASKSRCQGRRRSQVALSHGTFI